MGVATADEAAQAAFKVLASIIILGKIFGSLVEEERVICLGECRRGSQGKTRLRRSGLWLRLDCVCRSLGDILDGDGLGHGLWLLFENGNAELELGLCLGSTVKLLVNSHIARVEQHKGGGGVGVSLDHGLLLGGNV